MAADAPAMALAADSWAPLCFNEYGPQINLHAEGKKKPNLLQEKDRKRNVNVFAINLDVEFSKFKFQI